MKRFLFSVFCLCAGLTFVGLAQNSDAPTLKGGVPAFIDASVESLDFGNVEVGYPAFKTFMVSGDFLVEDICLTLEDKGASNYVVTPASISPEKALDGVIVSVKCLPYSDYMNNKEVNLRLSSQNAEDVIIPITVSAYYPEVQFVNNSTEEFIAPVGGVKFRRAGVRFDFIPVPTDPTIVDRSMGEIDESGIGSASLVPDYYTLSIEGPDCLNFTARYIKGSTLFGIATVEIIYTPRTSGSHTATLKLDCNNFGSSPVTIPLHGEATGTLGDIDDDGVICIKDVTGIIGLLLNGDNDSPCGDMDCDGQLSIRDVTLLINRLLTDN